MALWRGPYQNGVSPETGLVSSWSREGQNLIWRRDFTGRSTPIVFDGRVCANGRAGEGILRQEVVACWDAETGDQLWERRFTVYHTAVPWSRVGWANLAADTETGNVYALNVDGELVALDKQGKTAWSWRLGQDFGRASGYGGRTTTPLVDEDRIILHVIGSGWGPTRGPAVDRTYAFDKRTGDVLWVSPGLPPDDMNTQSSPMVTLLEGRRVVLLGYSGGTVQALDVRTGAPCGASGSRSGCSTAPWWSRATGSSPATARRTSTRPRWAAWWPSTAPAAATSRRPKSSGASTS
ncbi:MAG: PQQ-binding-like beta-propeller repeat protein [Thermoanaerobaculia bacterium]|nr:PQQ-binding-like beta-propeller repeat protein [Thermoanaerobaculia bacterium]